MCHWELSEIKWVLSFSGTEQNRKGLKLFDPWDGFADEFTVEQIFQSGFLSNSGPGIVKWIQYVAE